MTEHVAADVAIVGGGTAGCSTALHLSRRGATVVLSAPGRPKREALPLGGKARSAKGAHIHAPGRPKREALPLGGKARSASGAPLNARIR